MMVDKKTFILGVLSLSALILVVANILAPRGVIAADTIKDNDYQLQTGLINTGGDALYVTDNRSGMMAAFTFNRTRGTLEPVAPPKAVQDAFNVRGGNNRR
jgi:hypothetical protein